MSIVNTLDIVKDWLEANVCPLVELKLPNDSAIADEYPYELIHPAALALFVPSKDRMGPKIKAPIPSVCVQIISGNDSLSDHNRAIKLRLCFSTWDPGYHAQDIFIPTQSEGDLQEYNRRVTAAFEKNSEGWRDCWNFVDTTLRVVENAEYIGDKLRVAKESGISFGPITEQEDIVDYYPYWFAWVEFSVEEVLLRNPASYNQFL